ncbi:MAG: hypothetical protein F6K28_56430 [Microcoleus sp. SIO2G3]|nr:hypothetical protein [Microcoleus sp. SIO2G3]
MTAQQAFDEAIKRLDQARNEYLSNPAPIIELGTVSKSYWQTNHPIELGTPVGGRSDKIRVDFTAGKFSSPPKVQVMLNMLDAEQATNTRISVAPINITATGFEIEIGTWNESKVYGVGIAWLPM